MQGIKSDRAAGEYDVFVALAARFHWTPDQVLEMDGAFIDELAAFTKAEARARELDAERLRQ